MRSQALLLSILYMPYINTARGFLYILAKGVSKMSPRGYIHVPMIRQSCSSLSLWCVSLLWVNYPSFFAFGLSLFNSTFIAILFLFFKVIALLFFQRRYILNLNRYKARAYLCSIHFTFHLKRRSKVYRIYNAKTNVLYWSVKKKKVVQITWTNQLDTVRRICISNANEGLFSRNLQLLQDKCLLMVIKV